MSYNMSWYQQIKRQIMHVQCTSFFNLCTYVHVYVQSGARAFGLHGLLVQCIQLMHMHCTCVYTYIPSQVVPCHG